MPDDDRQDWRLRPAASSAARRHAEGNGALVYHKFKVGQTVLFAGGPQYQTNVRGRYKVVRLLPSDTADRQYRIQNITDGHERVVRESELQVG